MFLMDRWRRSRIRNLWEPDPRAAGDSAAGLRRLLVGLVLTVVSFVMAYAVDYGVTAGWPAWGRFIWGCALMAGALTGMLMAVTALDFVNEGALARAGNSRRVPGARTLILVYLGLMAYMVGLSLVLVHGFGVQARGGLMAAAGSVFLMSSLGRPWWLYAAVRRMGWFALVERDQAMRRVLAVLGAAMVTGGVAMGGGFLS